MPPSLSLQYAEGYLRLGMFTEAQSELDTIPPSAGSGGAVHFLRFQIYAAQRQWLPAARSAILLVRDYPEEPKHWLALAACARHIDSLSAAESILLAALAVHPMSGPIRYAIAGCACLLGREKEALHHLRIALRLDEDPEGYRAVQTVVSELGLPDF